MAFSASMTWEVQTGGSDTAAGGGFNPAQSNMATDGKWNGTSFGSASYTFVSGDVNHWLFIQSGTNWIPGWYKIASISSGRAVIDTTVGRCPLYDTKFGNSAHALNTSALPVTGSYVSDTASGKWSIDYSQNSATSLTSLANGGTNTQITSATGVTVGPNLIGNTLRVTSGSGWTVQTLEITNVSGGTITVDKTVGGTSLSGGAASLGGPLATPGMAGSLFVGGNTCWIKSGTYNLTGTTQNTAGGPVNDNTVNTEGQPNRWEGYGTYRTDKGTPPVIAANAQTSVTLFATANAYHCIDNITLDGSSGTSNVGISSAGTRTNLVRVKAQNCPGGGIAVSNPTNLWKCSATACGGTAAIYSTSNCSVVDCEAYANTVTGFASNAAATFVRCLSYGNTGGSSNGFTASNYGIPFLGCVAYGNGQHGFSLSFPGLLLVNCIAEANTGTGFIASAQEPIVALIACAVYGNGTDFSTNLAWQESCVTCTSSAFTNAASNDFSLNNTAGGGAALRAAGKPGVFPRGTTTGYIDIGAVQHADPATGGAFF